MATMMLEQQYARYMTVIKDVMVIEELLFNYVMMACCLITRQFKN